jgi:hypothetical protein
MHNMGTTLEHIVLTCAAAWACERSREVGALRYLDTHAMAPLNEPIGNDYDHLDDLRFHLAGIPPGQPLGAQQYFDTIGRADHDLLPAGAVCWYPTHFLHTWFAARTANTPLDGYLFENDAPDCNAQGRRQLIEVFIAALQNRIPAIPFCFPTNTAFEIAVPNDPALQITLARATGNFRDQRCWLPPNPRPGRALLIMSDPLMVDHRQVRPGAYMALQDFNFLGQQVTARYQDKPALTVHVVFCFGNPGYGQRYQDLTDALRDTWYHAFAAGVPVTERGFVGIKWGSFFVCAAAANASDGPWQNPTFQDAFQELEQRIETTLTGAKYWNLSPVQLHH